MIVSIPPNLTFKRAEVFSLFATQCQAMFGPGFFCNDAAIFVYRVYEKDRGYVGKVLVCDYCADLIDTYEIERGE